MQTKVIIGPQIHAILFDMDGVLLFSSELHDRAYRSVLLDLGIKSFEYERFSGMRTKDVFRTVLAENHFPGDEEQLARLTQKKSRLARTFIEKENPIANGLCENLCALKGHYKLALASSASSETVDLFLRLNCLHRMFRAVVDGEQVARAKPAPDIFLLAAKMLDVGPEHCLVVEDAVAGISAAKAAGMRAWAITTTQPAQVLHRAGADASFTNIGSLSKLLMQDVVSRVVPI